jgi:hypothetical protein
MVGDGSAGDARGAEETADESEWRFGVDEVGEESEGEGVAGPWAPAESIEPGRIDRENALFVVLGVVLAVAFFVLLLP